MAIAPSPLDMLALVREISGEGRDYQVKKNGPASCAAHEV